MALLAPPTLSKLLVNVRNFLNQPNPANSFWTDSELTEYLNEGIRMYFAEVVKNSEGYFQPTPALLNVVSGSETVELPTNFFEARGVYIKRSNGWEILQYQNNVTTGFITDDSGSTGSNTYCPSYYFQGNNLVLHPLPGYSETGCIRLEYVAFPDQMVNGGDSMTNQVSPIFKQLIEMYAVLKAKTKESMVTGVDMVSIPSSNLGQIYGIFKDTINKRSQSPEYVIPFSPEGY